MSEDLLCATFRQTKRYDHFKPVYGLLVCDFLLGRNKRKDDFFRASGGTV